MRILIHPTASKKEIDVVVEGLGFTPRQMPGAQRTVVAATGHQGPIVVDPPHSTGDVLAVPACTRAVGIDGITVDVHPEPEKTVCDGPRSIDPSTFTALMESLRANAPLVRKSI